MKIPTVLTIAGSDNMGGAGIQADIVTIAQVGCQPTNVITAVTAQNSRGVQAVFPLPTDIIAAQIDSVMSECLPSVIKIGMVYNADIVNCITDTLERYPKLPIIFDPVMVSTSGGSLLTPDTIDVITKRLFPICTLITPNIPEAAVLLNEPPATAISIVDTSLRLAQRYKCNVLLKGGHLSGNVLSDVLTCVDSDTTEVFSSTRIEGTNFHGTGCRLSSGIAAFLAKGFPLSESIRQSKSLLEQHYRDINR